MAENTFSIQGDTRQFVEVSLKPGGGVFAVSGTMIYMQADIEMAGTPTSVDFRGLKHASGKEHFSLTKFTNRSDEYRKLAFGAPYPGKIFQLDLDSEQGEYLYQQESFLCSGQDIEVQLALSKHLGFRQFDKEAYTLQKLVGGGAVFFHAGGNALSHSLKTGDRLRVDPNCIVGISTSIDYDIQFIDGLRNIATGRIGLFIAQLKGPGTVILQSHPFSRITNKLTEVLIDTNVIMTGHHQISNEKPDHETSI